MNQILENSIKKFENSKIIKRILIYTLTCILVMSVISLFVFNVLQVGNLGRIFFLFLSLVAIILGITIIVLGFKAIINKVKYNFLICIIAFFIGLSIIVTAGFSAIMTFVSFMINR